jgi:GT2 family glycosyltransferase
VTASPGDGRSETEDFASVTAVIVTWHSAPDTLALLAALREAFAEGLRGVIVDNASGDGTAEAVALAVNADSALRGAIRVVAEAENGGFTGGVNRGVNEALAGECRPRFIWLLNPDGIATAETLREMLVVATESGADITTVLVGGRYLEPDAWPRPLYGRPPDHWSSRAQGRWWPVGSYGGASVLFRSALVDRLIRTDGFFQDPELFMYWDEWDTTLRAKRFGVKTVVAAGARFQHPDGVRTLGDTADARFRQYYMARNVVIVSRRNMPAWQFWAVLPIHFARDLAWFVRVWRAGRQPHPWCYILGTIDAFLGRRGRWSRHPE